VDRVDVILSPYGGLGAYTRDDQVSHRYLTEEFRQLGTLASIFPPSPGRGGVPAERGRGRLVSLQRTRSAF